MRLLREPLIYVSYVTDDCFRRSSETTSRGRQNEAKRVRMLPGETLIPLTLFTALLLAWRLIPWYAAVIGGGFAILVAPLVLQQFPDRFVDGRASLLSFAAAGALLALLLVRLSVDEMI